MKRAACVLLTLLLWACEPASLPPPSIVSVVPEQVPAGLPSSLSVRVSAALPLVVNYQEKFVDPARLALAVQLGGRKVEIPFAQPDGTLIVPVPEDLAVGAYDIQVTLADGRETLRERAFSVVLAPTLLANPSGGDGGTRGDGGSTPTEPFIEVGGGITGIRIDPVSDQIRDRPFEITMRAEGPDANIYAEPVVLRASKGTVATFTPGSFARGVLVEEISLSQAGTGIYLLVEDIRGNKGLSNSFHVRPE